MPHALFVEFVNGLNHLNPHASQKTIIMNAEKLLLLILVCFGLLSGCSKYEMPGDELSEPDLKKAVKTAVFVVEPSGGDDTPAIVQAFEDAKAAGPGSAVQLSEGEYYIGFIEIREFCGSFMGKGKDKTVVTMINELNVDALLSQGLNTVLIRFVGGDVCIKNMAVVTPFRNLSSGSQYWIDGLLGLSAATVTYTSEKETIKGVVDNVAFSGHWTNIDHGLKAEFGARYNFSVSGGWPLFPMDITVTNCSFSGFWHYGALLNHINGGKVQAGIKNRGNIFTDNYYAGLGIWHNINLEANAEGNTFYSPSPSLLTYYGLGNVHYGVEISSAPYPAMLKQVAQTQISVYNIEQNVFNLNGRLGIYVTDRRWYFYPDDAPMLTEIKNNLFNLVSPALTGIGSVSNYGMVIRNNRFCGTSSFGVRVISGAPYPWNENGLMLGNNFSNLKCSDATVFFNALTRDWSVVGGNVGGDVINTGINNQITGFHINHSAGPFGQSIVDNLEEMREAKHAFKR